MPMMILIVPRQFTGNGSDAAGNHRDNRRELGQDPPVKMSNTFWTAASQGSAIARSGGHENQNDQRHRNQESVLHSSRFA